MFFELHNIWVEYFSPPQVSENSKASFSVRSVRWKANKLRGR